MSKGQKVTNILFGFGRVDDSAEEPPAVIGLSPPLPFFFFDFLDLYKCSLEATESASNCPGKTVGKPTTVGDAPVLSFHDGAAFSSAGGDGFAESILSAFEEADWSA